VPINSLLTRVYMRSLLIFGFTFHWYATLPVLCAFMCRSKMAMWNMKYFLRLRNTRTF
jgi:hypothetical protein